MTYTSRINKKFRVHDWAEHIHVFPFANTLTVDEGWEELIENGLRTTYDWHGTRWGVIECAGKACRQILDDRLIYTIVIESDEV